MKKILKKVYAFVKRDWLYLFGYGLIILQSIQYALLYDVRVIPLGVLLMGLWTIVYLQKLELCSWKDVSMKYSSGWADTIDVFSDCAKKYAEIEKVMASQELIIEGLKQDLEDADVLIKNLSEERAELNRKLKAINAQREAERNKRKSSVNEKK